jgi:ketosteroid isomerase-like protein
VSASHVEVVRSAYELVGDVAALTRDEAATARVEERLRGVLSPDVKTTLNGPPYSDIHETAWGIEGYRNLWRDWVRPFHSYLIEVEELVDLDGRVLALTVGRARIEPDSPVVTNRGGTIWTFEEGRVSEVDSYMERADAERMAYDRT